MAGTSGQQPSARGPRRANKGNFAKISEAARLFGVSEADVLKQVKDGDLHLNEPDLDTNPVSEFRAVSFNDAVRNTGKDPAEIERRIKNGDVRLKVPRAPG
jgi:hypothetical protein